MPPRKSGTGTPGAVGLHPGMITGGTASNSDANHDSARAGGPSTLKYTTLTGVSGALQTKNMSSAFMKEDRNSYWNRRKNDTSEVLKEMKDAKRRRLDVEDNKENGNGHAGENGDDLEDTKSTSGGASGRGMSIADMLNDGGGEAAETKPSQKPDLKGKGREVMVQGPAPLPDPSKVLIFHPGARTLRFGRATDSVPFEVPYVIARKMRSSVTTNGQNQASTSSKRYKDMSEDQLDILKHDLKGRMKILKLRGTSGGSQAAKEYNESVKAMPVAPEMDDFPITWTDASSAAKDVCFGEEALRLDAPEQNGWVQRWPYYGGRFNTEQYCSARELLSDVQDIWTDALRSKCEIQPRDLEEYSVILIIPDLFDDVYIREMTELLLVSMGFAQIVLQQEGICATFAAGLPSACVVDIGSSGISISCIDEGMVINDSRMLMQYGGDDMVETFMHLLRNVDFPYKECNLAKEWDWELVQWLMDQCCSANEHNFGVNLFEFSARGPKQKTMKYTMKLHDEVTLPTMCFWSPRVLDWERKLSPRPVLWASKEDIEGPIEIGSNAVTGAMRQSTAHLTQPRPGMAQMDSAGLAVSGAEGTNGEAGGLEVAGMGDDAASATSVSRLGTPNPDLKASLSAPADLTRASSPAVSLSGKAGAKAGTPIPADIAPVYTIDYATESSKLPLDVAVFESICQSGSDDKVKRVATNILVVGGVGNLQGIGWALQSRLEPLMRHRFPAGPSPLVIPRSKYADPAHMAWKGIQNLCRLDVVNDLWVRRDDWELLNLRALRDRSFFMLP